MRDALRERAEAPRRSDLSPSLVGSAATVPLATALSDAPSASGARAVSLGPEMVAQLLLGGPIGFDVDLVSLEPDQIRGYKLWLRKSGRDVISMEVDEDVGAAAAVTLARALGLDPLIEVGTLEAPGNARRVQVHANQTVGEVLVSMAASNVGISVESRRLGSDSTNATGPLRRCVRCQLLEFAPLETCPRDGSPLVAVLDSPEPGATVGVYRVSRVLGEGGMGTVLEGEHVVLRKRVAIKVMRRSLATHPAAASAFLREARAAAAIRHPNVVEVTDFGLMTSGQPYMVMELLSGESLDRWLDDAGALQPKAALSIAREIALGLEAAHARGVLHNDLKPSNIMLLTRPNDAAVRLKIVDFGAASVGADRDLDPDSVTGTPAYMAPERVRGLPSDARADLYALGIVLYEMLGGSVPFAGGSMKQVMLAHVLEPLPPLASPTGVLPHAVASLIERALRKDPDGRHQSAGEMIGEIERALAACDRPDWRRWLP